jgi:hypothetical protein
MCNHNNTLNINNILINYFKLNNIDKLITEILETINFHNSYDVNLKIAQIKNRIKKGRIPFDTLLNITYFYENNNEINYKHYIKIYPDSNRLIYNRNINNLKSIRRDFKKNILKIIDLDFLLFLQDNNLNDIEMSIELINL